MKDFSHIWCQGCGAIRPLLVDYMEGDDVSAKFTDATDLVCGHCRLVIDTLYNAKSDVPAQGTENGN